MHLKSGLYSRGCKNRATADKKLKFLAIFISGLEFDFFTFLSFDGTRGRVIYIQDGYFNQAAHLGCCGKP
jgi:hypothetical protein